MRSVPVQKPCQPRRVGISDGPGQYLSAYHQEGSALSCRRCLCQRGHAFDARAGYCWFEAALGSGSRASCSKSVFACLATSNLDGCRHVGYISLTWQRALLLSRLVRGKILAASAVCDTAGTTFRGPCKPHTRGKLQKVRFSAQDWIQGWMDECTTPCCETQPPG